ncbi:amidase [Lipingzhangella halophila]|uniref:Amidase n=1 Tax=Lipingzhangella halophila TaxID=1783352 RepID=A0A7W7W6K4_9ACTN|nr:acetamidase/formamidase family protein [Lipingzhangella halophila]MBB4935024.1 amidase [Lipingzhangella halophila]
MRVLTADRAATEFSAHFEAVAAVGLGESFAVRTVDCYDGQISDERVLRPDIDMARFNRASGPVSVTGTRPGEWARIVIERIEVASPGVMALTPGLGVLGDMVERPSTRLLEVSGGRAWLTPDVGICLHPMVGILGVATAHETVPGSTPGEHGGNLDTRVLTAGTALAVRVNQPGLGVCVGDLHAAMGDGELGGTGVEIAGEVRLRVERLNEHTGRWPLVLGADGVQVLASRTTLDAAVRDAFREAVTLMARWHNLEWPDAYRLTSVVSDLRVSQVVNPRATARIAIPAQWCPASLLMPAPE